MKSKRYTEEQIIGVLKEAEAGAKTTTFRIQPDPPTRSSIWSHVSSSSAETRAHVQIARIKNRRQCSRLKVRFGATGVVRARAESERHQVLVEPAQRHVPGDPEDDSA